MTVYNFKTTGPGHPVETGDYYDTKSLNAEYVSDCMADLRRAA